MTIPGRPVTTGSSVVYRNPWMSVREDTFRRPDGSDGVYGVVDKEDFSIVIAETSAETAAETSAQTAAETSAGTAAETSAENPAETLSDTAGVGGTGTGAAFHLVEQYRYPLGRRAWEFPMGTWPAGAGGSPLELARAELREETGVQADHWRHLGRLHEAGGFCSQGFDVFHATGLHAGSHAREASEADMVHALVPEAQFLTMIDDGRIVDAATISAYFLLLRHRSR